MIIAKDFSVRDNSVYLADLLEALALLPQSADPRQPSSLPHPARERSPPAPLSSNVGSAVKPKHSRTKETDENPAGVPGAAPCAARDELFNTDSKRRRQPFRHAIRKNKTVWKSLPKSSIS